MVKLEIINTCDCLNKLLIIGYLREFESDEEYSNYYLGNILDGHIVMKMDIVVDNGWYDDYGNYNTNFEITSSYYPIEFCPICGKKIEYLKTCDKSLKVV